MGCCGSKEKVIFIRSLGNTGDIEADNEAINYAIEKFKLRPVYDEHKKLYQKKP